MSGTTGLRAALCVLALIVRPRFAAADVLGPWTAGPTTNGYWLNNGIAGGHGHLYTVTSIGAEVSAIQPDGSPGPWAGTASPNLARSLAITLTTGCAVYVAGGHTGSDPAAATATVEVAPIQADGSLGPWQYTSSMTVARTNHAGALGAGRLYMLGNYGGSTSVESAAVLTDGTLGPWRTETVMNQSRERPGAAVVNNFLYALGGLPFTTSVERAPIGSDGVLGAWSYVAPMQEARYELGAAAIGALLFAVGGYNDTQGGFASVESSDFTGDGFGSWSFTSSLPSPYWNANATAVGNVLYVVGATEQYSGPSDKSVEFAATSPSTTTSTLPSGGDELISGRRLVLKDSPDTTKRSISAVSSDTAITLGGGNGSADDPTRFGGSVRIRTSTGDLFDSTYNLPTTGWKTIGAPGQNKGYRFTSGTGPIKRVVVRPGKAVRVRGTGAFTATLSTNPNPVDVVLRTGARRYCAEFGGAVTFEVHRRFTATSAPAPSSCPTLADWPTYGFDLTRNRFNPREGLINASTVSRLNVRWFFSTGNGTAAVSASPSVVDGVLYVGSWNGTMYALDASSGQPLWTFNINDPNPGDRNGFPGIQSSAAVAAGMVYFGAADANVYALDAQTGALVWKTSLGNPDTSVEGAHVWSSPAVFDGKVYVGKASHLDFPCVRGALVALDAATGAEVWRFDTLPEHICGTDTQKPCTTDADCCGGSCVPFLVCRSGSGGQSQSQLCSSNTDCTAPATCQPPLGGGVTSSPAIDGGKGAVYVSVGDCVGSGATGFAESILALDIATHALRWNFGPIPPGNLQDLDFVASPNVFMAPEGMTIEPLVGAGNKNGVYYAVDQDTGALVWQQPAVPAGILGGFNASTGVALGNIYAGTFTGPPFIFALGTVNGSVAWQCPSAECGASSFGPPGIAAGVVFIGDSTGQLRAFDAATGAVLRKLDLGGGISSGPAIVNDMVIVGVGTGAFGSGQKQGVYGLALQ